ncbi:MAG TPA: M36 family metallopeptidase, partial [Pyrinomonadaceae bacterium]|nr:M36 family metallopeptidase [Pyrinomonadaceae bacterium]
ATGLTGNMARGMGEGWSDFFALAMLSEPTDDQCGINAVGGYVTRQIISGFEANYYYGIRRFPVARRACLGPNGKPHNPLTFRYVNSDCNTLIGTTTSNPPPNSAFPRGPIGVTTCDQIHNLGEFWSAVLWEVRGQLIDIHGAADGNRRAMQYVTDGMKISPINPTMLQARDAIVTAANVSDPTDLVPVSRGFALRGMGLSASIQNTGTGSNNTIVTESFDGAQIASTRVRADFDGDGRSDISVFRPSEGVWYENRSAAGFTALNWGLAGDQLTPGDFDGDGKSDIAVFRAAADPSLPDFYVLRSADSSYAGFSWGLPGDVPVVADYDGDDKSDIAVFRPSSHTYYVRRSSTGDVLTYSGIVFGVPVAGDFDGDGKADFASYSINGWFLSQSNINYASVTFVRFGTSGDRPVPGDYD